VRGQYWSVLFVGILLAFPGPLTHKTRLDKGEAKRFYNAFFTTIAVLKLGGSFKNS
jgi:hypothetical protein